MKISSQNSDLISKKESLSNPIFELTEQERQKQKNTLNLIASENYPSKKVLELLGSVWSNKYGEGYPGKRYYAGNQFTDSLESFAQQKALEVFDTECRIKNPLKHEESDAPLKRGMSVTRGGVSLSTKNSFLGSTAEYAVNLQVLSGSPANSMVFLSVLEYGDTILSLNLANGGHLSHLHATSNWNKFFKLVNYDVKLVEEMEENEAKSPHEGGAAGGGSFENKLEGKNEKPHHPFTPNKLFNPTEQNIGSNLKIRPATSTDLKDIIQIYSNGMADIFNDDFDQETISDFIQTEINNTATGFTIEILENNPGFDLQINKGSYFVLENSTNNQILGYLVLKLKKNNELKIEDLFIATTQQGKGLGKFLLEYILAKYNAEFDISLSCNVKNVRANKLYEKYGLEITEIKDREFKGSSFKSNFRKIKIGTYKPKNPKTIHLIGLFSDSDKYSELEDWAKMIEIACQNGAEKIVLHLIADGLDTDRKLVEIWQEFVEKYEEILKPLENKIFLGSLGGREFFDKQPINALSAMFIKEPLQKKLMIKLENETHIFQSLNAEFHTITSDYFDLDDTDEDGEDKFEALNKFLFKQAELKNNFSNISKILDLLSQYNYQQNHSDKEILPVWIGEHGGREADNGIKTLDTIYLLNYDPNFAKFTEILVGINKEFDLNLNILANFESGVEGIQFYPVENQTLESKIMLKFPSGGVDAQADGVGSVPIKNQVCYEIDEEDFEAKLIEFKPKLTILGASSYPRIINFTRLTEIAHYYGSLVLADVAHINGLIASGLHPSPFHGGASGADFVTMTTHKTMRGPRGAMIFMKKEFEKAINKTIFPGTSGGPHFNKIAAIGQCCLEILGQDYYPDGVSFEQYSQNVLATSKALENSLVQNGLEIISPTQNHLCLVKLPESADSLEIQQKLEAIGIICNRNVLPNDTKSAWRPGGLRLGTAALASRGLTVEMTTTLGQIIADTVFEQKTQEELKAEVQKLVQKLNWWY